MKPIETSRNKAILRAKRELRKQAGTTRLSSFMYVDSRCQCACGETYAIDASTLRGGKLYSIIVGVCEICGKN